VSGYHFERLIRATPVRTAPKTPMETLTADANPEKVEGVPRTEVFGVCAD
jgi:hypothetical protein